MTAQRKEPKHYVESNADVSKRMSWAKYAL